MPTADLQPILDELAVMKGIIEILSPLAPDTRARVLIWLQSVTATGAGAAPRAGREPRSEAGERLAARIAELSRGAVPEVPAASEAPETETDKTRASRWRSKHT
jgi:hypothetical protein